MCIVLICLILVAAGGLIFAATAHLEAIYRQECARAAEMESEARALEHTP